MLNRTTSTLPDPRQITSSEQGLPPAPQNALSMTSGISCFEVLPSEIIESQIMAEAQSKKKPTIFIGNRDRLSAEELRIADSLNLARLQKLKSTALELQNLARLEEYSLIISLRKRDMELTNLDPHNALQVARAACNVLYASQQLAIAKVMEAQSQLETLIDGFEKANAQLQEGQHQLSNILSELHTRCIVVVPMPYRNIEFARAASSWRTLAFRSRNVRMPSGDSSVKSTSKKRPRSADSDIQPRSKKEAFQSTSGEESGVEQDGEKDKSADEDMVREDSMSLD
ncbi:hypothetical protein CVT26_014957 [Gymnopilus dilepis]|uniref:Uncharacterized protein n=1 Tax=Gymnopilus dilepis TaxID=231916 RepID=A0A409W3S7_9AGAR|nr:hypothetical protein CVT26_014957 [Gymnopilus dilepis]